MFNISLQTLILYEVIFVLVVICVILLLVLIKQKKVIRELQEQFIALRKRMHHILSKIDYADTDNSANPKHGDQVGTYLHNTAQYALERFKKFVPDGIPSLNPSHDFGAKVAALRYLYIMAEAENRSKQNAPENWLLLEKKLSDIVRWIRNIPKSQHQSGNRIKQLYEKVDQLKRHATENSHLKRHLTLAREKNQALDEENKQHKENLKKMQTMIGAFQRAVPGNSGLPETEETITTEVANSAQRHERAYNAYQSSIFQVNNISQISQRKQELLQQLSDKFNRSFANANENDRNNLTDKLATLQSDVQGSDNHISSLQSELKIARDHIAQLREKPQEPMDASMPAMIITPGETQEAHPYSKASAWIEEGGHERTLAEIEQLRSNNQRQRMLILELNTEINQLREQMDDTQDETIKQEKSKEIVKLERLVKECEYCIETLESEVDLLREQISDEHDSELMHPDIQKLNKDIEQMSAKLHQTINQCTNANIINQFSTNLLDCKDIESIAQLIVDTLKKFDVNFGFYLDCVITQIEYHSDGKSTPQEQKALKFTENASVVGYINEGILFFRPHARIIIKNPPDDDADQAIIETSINTLTQLTNAKINHIESLMKLSRQDERVVQSVEQVKAQLTTIQNQHETQAKTAKYIIDALAKEVKASIKLLNPSSSVISVFENVIDESIQRVDALDQDSKNVQKHTKDIINALEQLR